MTDAPKPRWYRLTPDRLVLLLLVIEGLLWLSERLAWPAWHKGYAVLAAVASVGVAMMAMLLWFAVSLLFRWRFQFSLRSLLVLVVAVAVPCNWMAVEMKEAQQQKEAVRAILEEGDRAIFDYEDMAATEPPGLAWLRNLLGEDFFATVVGVGFSRSPFVDAGSEHLKGATQFQVLDFAFTQVTDADLQHLKELTQLQMLNLECTRVTDTGLEHLKGLTQLRELWLFGTKVTDEGVKKLQQALPNCKIQR